MKASFTIDEKGRLVFLNEITPGTPESAQQVAATEASDGHIERNKAAYKEFLVRVAKQGAPVAELPERIRVEVLALRGGGLAKQEAERHKAEGESNTRLAKRVRTRSSTGRQRPSGKRAKSAAKRKAKRRSR